MTVDVSMSPAPSASHSWRWSYIASAAMAIAAIVICELLSPVMRIPALTLILLLPAVISAQQFGLGQALLAAAIGSLAWDLLFTEPLYELRISDPQDVAVLVTFGAVALFISGLTSHIRTQNAHLEDRAAVLSGLYRFSRGVSGIGNQDELVRFALKEIRAQLRCFAVALLPEEGGKGPLHLWPQGARLNPADLADANRLWPDGFAGDPSDLIGGNEPRMHFVPLITHERKLGFIGIRHDRNAPVLSSEEAGRLESLLGQLSIAIERLRFERKAQEIRMRTETERLRDALMMSVSHDLRTPLTTILGALTALGEVDESDQAAREELITTARLEAERLDRFVGNLLDMAKLETGAIQARLEAVDVGEIIESALFRARRLLSAHKVEVDLPVDLPDALANFALAEQVVFNLLDNAAKYTAAGRTIRIAARSEPDARIIEISDEGPGIPPDLMETIWQGVNRFAAADRQNPGTGLGLIICKRFMQAIGGEISVANRSGGGTVFTIRLQGSAPRTDIARELAAPL